jgi:hypothetical protein
MNENLSIAIVGLLKYFTCHGVDLLILGSRFNFGDYFVWNGVEGRIQVIVAKIFLDLTVSDVTGLNEC